MVLLELVVELLERLEILDSDAHLFDFLVQLSATLQSIRKGVYLAEHEIPFRELNEHLFCSECIVKLQFEIFDLDLCVGKLDERGLIIACSKSVRCNRSQSVVNHTLLFVQPCEILFELRNPLALLLLRLLRNITQPARTVSVSCSVR